MVYLDRIYTKSGDAGETSLGGGSRVPKTDARIVAYGGVDELNSVIGVALVSGVTDVTADWLKSVQNDLFDLGADLCVPTADKKNKESGQPKSRVTAQQVAKLEHWIDTANEPLHPLKSFVLPGGSLPAAHLHHARAVCRRVEIGVLQLAEREDIPPAVAIYLNRLSDLLFVLARRWNNNGNDDVLWVPGKP